MSGISKLDFDFFEDYLYAIQPAPNKCTKCLVDKYIPCKDYCTIKSVKPDSNENILPRLRKKTYKEVRDTFLTSKLHVFAKLRDIDGALEVLRRGANLHLKTLGGVPPIYFAIINGCPHFVKLLIDWGSDVNEMIPCGISGKFQPILHLAIGEKNVEVVQQLLHFGANVHLCNSYGSTALHEASIDASGEIARLLLAHGADAFKLDTTGCPPLYNAARDENKNMCALLLKHGANINQAITSSGDRIIQVASFNCDTDLVRMCIKKKANINVLNAKKETSLHLVTQYHKFFERNYCDCSWGNEIFCDNLERIDTAFELLTNGAQVNTKNIHGETPLHLAVEIGCLYLIQILLDYGADVNAIDDLNRVPLEIATSGYEIFYEIIKLLLIYGANYECLLTDLTHLLENNRLMLIISQYRTAKQLAGFSNDVCKVTLPKCDLQVFKSKCAKELEIIETVNIGNATLKQLLCTNKRILAHLMSKHKNPYLSRIIPFIKDDYPIYGPMLRKNWSIGKKYAPVFKKAATLFESLDHRLPIEVAQEIVSYLDYDSMKVLIRAIHEVRYRKRR